MTCSLLRYQTNYNIVSVVAVSCKYIRCPCPIVCLSVCVVCTVLLFVLYFRTPFLFTYGSVKTTDSSSMTSSPSFSANTEYGFFSACFAFSVCYFSFCACSLRKICFLSSFCCFFNLSSSFLFFSSSFFIISRVACLRAGPG